MTGDQATQDFFRCPVHSEQSRASLRCGMKLIPVTLRETSIDGFTVVVDSKYATRLKVGQPWILRTSSERNIVHGEWIFLSREGTLQMGLRRVRELTPEGVVGNSWLRSIFCSGRRGDQGTGELPLFGLLLFIFMLLSTPPVGNPLGTAPRIRAVVGELLAVVRGLLS